MPTMTRWNEKAKKMRGAMGTMKKKLVA